MKPASADEPGEDQPLVAALAHDLDERAAEQDQHARAISPMPITNAGSEDDAALPVGSRWRPRPNRSLATGCRAVRAVAAILDRSVTPDMTDSGTNYTSGDEYIVEFLGFRFTFNAFDFEQRVIAAAVKLGLVEANELDDEETRDLVALAAQGVIEDPESRLGRYLARNWERVALVDGESLVYWLRKLVFRGAWLDHQVKRGALEIVWDDVEAEFAYQHPGGGRPLLELAPVPSWHELQFRGRAPSTAGDDTGRPRSSAAPLLPSRVELPRCRTAHARCSSPPPAPSTSRPCSRSTTTRRYPQQLAARRGSPGVVLIAWLTRIPARAAGAGDRRRPVRDDRRGHGLADLGRLHLPARQPADVRPARARARLPHRRSRSRSRSRGTARLVVARGRGRAVTWGVLGLLGAAAARRRRRARRAAAAALLLALAQPRDLRGRLPRRRRARVLRHRDRHVALGGRGARASASRTATRRRASPPATSGST